MLFVVTHVREAATGSTRSVTGTLATAPRLRAPLTDRPCVAWALTLWHLGEPRRIVWRRERVQDLEIAYDLHWTHDARHGDPDRADIVARPGTVDVAGDLIDLASIITPDGSHDIPLDRPALARLHALGLPGDLRSAITAAPGRYRLTEASLTTGDLVRCHQDAHRVGFRLQAEHRTPDDHATWIWGLLILLFLTAAALLTGATLIDGPPFPEPV